jgi:hypothetical protein
MAVSVRLSSVRRSAQHPIQPTISPISTPPAEVTTNCQSASVSEKVPVTAAATAER